MKYQGENLSFDNLIFILNRSRSQHERFLIAATCNHHGYEMLLNESEQVEATCAGDFFAANFGIKIYLVASQVETVKYWYSDEQEAMRGFLAKNL